MSGTIRLWAAVFKLRIGVAIMLCALAGVAATPGSGPGAAPLLVLALAVLLSSASAGAYNQYAERELDAHMGRTRTRPFVTGQLRADWRWPAAIGLLLAMSVAGAWFATNALAAAFVFLGAFTYGIVYTVWLKRLTWLNIVVGGLAGSFAVLAGAAAVDPNLALEPAILALVLFLWTPPHFWSLAFAYRRDYRAAGVPMLPVVVSDAASARVIFAHTVALTALSLVPGFLGLGAIYLSGAIVGGAWFLHASWQLVRQPDTRHAMRNFHASLGQLSLLLLATIVDRWLLG
ncbi:MAG: heme o synthase [Gammaproteobacteria bacterium]